jgi:hypothetical protein
VTPDDERDGSQAAARTTSDEGSVQVKPGDGPEPTVDREGGPADPTEQSFGRYGWVLVGVLVVSLIVVPWTIVLLPEAQRFLGSLGLGMRDAYLVLPMFPALLLGAIAVWTAVTNDERRQ